MPTFVPKVKNSLRARFGGVAVVRAALTSLVTTTCLLSLTSCNGDTPEAPSPSPTSNTSSTSPTAPTSASSSPTEPAVPPYLASYTKEERAAYDAAIRDYESFSDRQARINAKGKARESAKLFYRQRTAAWQTYWARLRANESQGLQIIGKGRTLRIRPADIELYQGGGGQVDLRVCGVAEDVEVLVGGEPVPQPTPKPTIVRVRMVHLPDEAVWRVLSERVGPTC